jgi:hypothetical protein
MSRFGIVGCHDRLLIGECWTIIANGDSNFKDQIHTVVGIESFLVAIRVPSGLLNVIVEIPTFGLGSVGRELTVGGHIGWAAVI